MYVVLVYDISQNNNGQTAIRFIIRSKRNGKI